MLRFMGLQRVGHDQATELTEPNWEAFPSAWSPRSDAEREFRDSPKGPWRQQT